MLKQRIPVNDILLKRNLLFYHQFHFSVFFLFLPDVLVSSVTMALKMTSLKVFHWNHKVKCWHQQESFSRLLISLDDQTRQTSLGLKPFTNCRHHYARSLVIQTFTHKIHALNLHVCRVIGQSSFNFLFMVSFFSFHFDLVVHFLTNECFSKSFKLFQVADSTEYCLYLFLTSTIMTILTLS